LQQRASLATGSESLLQPVYAKLGQHKVQVREAVFNSGKLLFSSPVMRGALSESQLAATHLAVINSTSGYMRAGEKTQHC
jgi:hypothetical protein